MRQRWWLVFIYFQAKVSGAAYPGKGYQGGVKRWQFAVIETQVQGRQLPPWNLQRVDVKQEWRPA